MGQNDNGHPGMNFNPEQYEEARQYFRERYDLIRLVPPKVVYRDVVGNVRRMTNKPASLIEYT